ncbi:MAG TPA: tagaturonate reductase [Chthonomonadaceae bacterium]|nr:tagaturonate reductase [Chthonomonadaceae bacterium]
MTELPETVLQFGGGKFLRAFADLFIHQANEQGQNVGRVVVVQSTDSGRAQQLNAQGGRYHVAVRGLSEGQLVDRVEEAASIRRALVAQTEWDKVLEVARSPELRYILSNTTEAGLALNPEDRLEDAPPRSFPAKLLLLLKARHESGLPGLTILPTELLEDNADRLRALLLEQARLWNLPEALAEWLQTECAWPNTLVDRIVTDKPAGHPLLAQDPLLTMAEPFAFWAIQEKPNGAPLCQHWAIQYTGDVKPFFLRKVRILNAAHTAMTPKALARGIKLVREAMQDAELRSWLEGLLFEEVLPVLEGRVAEPETFARQTLERFSNPFLDHKFSDIAIYHDAKVKIRLVPTRDEFIAKFGRTPRRLEEAIQESANLPL